MVVGKISSSYIYIHFVNILSSKNIVMINRRFL